MCSLSCIILCNLLIYSVKVQVDGEAAHAVGLTYSASGLSMAEMLTHSSGNHLDTVTAARFLQKVMQRSILQVMHIAAVQEIHRVLLPGLQTLHVSCLTPLPPASPSPPTGLPSASPRRGKACSSCSGVISGNNLFAANIGYMHQAFQH